MIVCCVIKLVCPIRNVRLITATKLSRHFVFFTLYHTSPTWGGGGGEREWGVGGQTIEHGGKVLGGEISLIMGS